MLLELFPLLILNNVMAFVNAYIHCLKGASQLVFSDFLCFDISRCPAGYLISIAYCHFFHFLHENPTFISKNLIQVYIELTF